MAGKYFEGEHKADTDRLLVEMEEQSEHVVEVLGNSYRVYRSVFSPKYFKDTEHFARELRVNPGEHILEIGTGAGIVGIHLARNNDVQALLTDINLMAVINAKTNARIAGVPHKVDVIESDVYNAVPDWQKDKVEDWKKFDMIFWDTPWSKVPRQELSPLAAALFNPEYESIERFVRQAPNFLRPTGRLEIGFSYSMGDRAHLERLLDETGFAYETIFSTKSTSVGHPCSFEIVEAKLKK